MEEVSSTLQQFDADDQTRCFIITGNEKSFSVGADVNMMKDETSFSAIEEDYLSYWDSVNRVKKPIIAAVNGFALGGGLELAMSCDIIIAGESAKLGQPEVGIGTIPGAGGTQRLTKIVGKHKAMEMILTCSPISSTEALQLGLVSKVVPDEFVLPEAKRLAHDLARKPPLALKFAKEAILKSFEMTLEQGVCYERKLFYQLFSSDDLKEGIKAFLQKRKPTYMGR
jgi:enoyl-CoA hydratase